MKKSSKTNHQIYFHIVQAWDSNVFSLSPWSDVICICEMLCLSWIAASLKNQMILIISLPLWMLWLCCFGLVLDKRHGFWWSLKKSLESIFSALIFLWNIIYGLKTLTIKKRESKRQRNWRTSPWRSHQQTGQKYDNIWHVILSFLSVTCSIKIEVHRDIEPGWSKILKTLLVGHLNPFLFWFYFRN